MLDKSKIKKILVLGKNGMLGHMVHDFLSSLEKYQVFGTIKRDLDAICMSDKEIEERISSFSPDYVINCVGLIIRYANSDEEAANKVNSVFPHLLADLGIKHGWKVIHISTDCYLDKDIYGRSKFLGEINDRHNLTIRTSLIGPELKEGYGLFHWFMSQKGPVDGFTKAYWDGVTTLQLSKFIEECINSKDRVGIIDYRTKNSTSKYELLKLISNIFSKKIEIRADNREMKDKRNPNADFWCTKTYSEQISELREYMLKNKGVYSRYLNE